MTSVNGPGDIFVILNNQAYAHIYPEKNKGITMCFAEIFIPNLLGQNNKKAGYTMNQLNVNKDRTAQNPVGMDIDALSLMAYLDIPAQFGIRMPDMPIEYAYTITDTSSFTQLPTCKLEQTLGASASILPVTESTYNQAAEEGGFPNKKTSSN